MWILEAVRFSLSLEVVLWLLLYYIIHKWHSEMKRSSSPRLSRRREERGVDTFYCTTTIVSLSLIKLSCEVVFKFACKLHFKLWWRLFKCDKTQMQNALNNKIMTLKNKVNQKILLSTKKMKYIVHYVSYIFQYKTSMIMILILLNILHKTKGNRENITVTNSICEWLKRIFQTWGRKIARKA